MVCINCCMLFANARVWTERHQDKSQAVHIWMSLAFKHPCVLVSPSGPSRPSFKHLVHLCLLPVHHGHSLNILCTCACLWSLAVIVQTSCVLVSPSGPSRLSFKHLVYLCLLILHGHRLNILCTCVAFWSILCTCVSFWSPTVIGNLVLSAQSLSAFRWHKINQSKIRYSLHLSWTTNALSACLYALRHRKIIWN